jgi:hypothetical protein
MGIMVVKTYWLQASVICHPVQVIIHPFFGICHVLLMFYVLSDLSVLRKNPGPDKSNKVIDLDLYHPFEATPVHQSQWDSSFTCLLQRTNLFDLDVLLLMGRIPKNGPKRHGCTMVFLMMHCVCGSVTRP